VFLVTRDAAELKMWPLHSTKTYVRFIPQSWRIKENMETETWSTVVCEINLVGNFVVFKAFIGPRGPWDWRVKMHALAQKEKFPNTYRAAQPPPQWYSFYAVKGPENKAYDISAENIADYASEVWTWAKAEISSERFLKMAKAVLPLLAELPVMPHPVIKP